MIERRDILKGALVASVAVSATSASACRYAMPKDDGAGKKIVEFLTRGNADILDGMFNDDSTLVLFDPKLFGPDKFFYQGRGQIIDTMKVFRTDMLKGGFSSADSNGNPGRKLAHAKIVGNKRAGLLNKIELLFADDKVSLTSCGPSRARMNVSFYYQSDYSGDIVKRIAIVPSLGEGDI